jgi:hypothetical protein
VSIEDASRVRGLCGSSHLRGSTSRLIPLTRLASRCCACKSTSPRKRGEVHMRASSGALHVTSPRKRGEVDLLPIKIARHALPRRAFRRADIRRRRRKNRLPRLPLLRMRHACERVLEATVRIAAAGGVPPARLQRARAPQLERLAIAPLLQRFLGGKARRVFLRRQLQFAYRFAQRIISVRGGGIKKALRIRSPPPLTPPHPAPHGGGEKRHRFRGAFSNFLILRSERQRASKDAGPGA